MSDISFTSDSSESSSESSDDDDYLDLFDDIYLNRARPKNENYFEVIVPRYNDEEFMEHFRVSRHVAESLAERFSNSQYFNYQAGGNGKLSSYRWTIIFLWFAGHQTASFRDVSDRFNIAKSTLHKVIQRMVYFISNLSHEIIKWPTGDEITAIERHFRQKHFPGVIGAIDGTHIRIDKPEIDPDSYLNRKSFYSIQLQVVCDNTRKIRDVFLGFPGSVHDSRVFRRSPLQQSLPEKCGDFYILGDSGYPCLRNLLTPFRDRGQLRRAEKEYNVKLARNRYVIEHCFGLLKQKFRQLYHIKLKEIPDIVHFIRACCVLHNLALNDNFEYNENEQAGYEVPIALEEMDFVGVEDRDDRDGLARRNYVAFNIL